MSSLLCMSDDDILEREIHLTGSPVSRFFRLRLVLLFCVRTMAMWLQIGSSVKKWRQEREISKIMTIKTHSVGSSSRFKLFTDDEYQFPVLVHESNLKR